MQSFEEQGIKMEEQRVNILRSLEQKHRNATKLYEEYEEKTKGNKKVLDQCRIGKLLMYTRIYTFRFCLKLRNHTFLLN